MSIEEEKNNVLLKLYIFKATDHKEFLSDYTRGQKRAKSNFNCFPSLEICRKAQAQTKQVSKTSRGLYIFLSEYRFLPIWKLKLSLNNKFGGKVLSTFHLLKVKQQHCIQNVVQMRKKMEREDKNHNFTQGTSFNFPIIFSKMNAELIAREK